jgi:mitogen-activated protein kinase 15
MSEEIDKNVRRRFNVEGRLGKGAYGIVWAATEIRTGRRVALKKCFDAFRNATDAQRTYREIMYLQQLAGHDSIIRMQHVIRAENNKDIYLTFDHLETDLHAVIRANILEDIHKKYIIYQLLKALKFMHSGELLHRDIKPSNLLLNADCKAKLCDFGLCRSVGAPSPQQHQQHGAVPVLTDYVATRWYRSPEILLGSTIYSKGVDMWAVGCILGEMLLGKPLFPGSSTLDQLQKVMHVTGFPSAEAVENLRSPFAKAMLEQAAAGQQPAQKGGGRSGVGLHGLIPNQSRDAYSLLDSCLQFDPKRRCR